MHALCYNNETLFLDKLFPKPILNNKEALIRVTRAGICNTDVEITRGYMGFSGIPGHEFTGIVENCYDSSWIGKRVVGEINCFCGQCETCRNGDTSHCPDRTTLGIYNRNGVFAEYCSLPYHLLHEIPDNVSDDEAVFTEPLAAALEICERVHLRPQDRIYVVGDGKLGLLTAQVLRLSGCDLTIIGRHREKLGILSRLKVKTILESDLKTPAKGDVVIDCTGHPSGFDLSVSLLKPRGKLVLKSTFHGNNQVNLTSFVVDEMMLVGSRCGPFAPALRLLEQKLVDVIPLIENTYKLTKSVSAFEKAKQKGALKILLDCTDEN